MMTILTTLLALTSCHIMILFSSGRCATAFTTTIPSKSFNKPTHQPTHHFVSKSSNKPEIHSDVQSNLNKNDEQENEHFSLNRRLMTSTTLGLITSGIIASTSKIEQANASEFKRLPLDVVVNKIEKGLYFGPDMRKNLEKVPQFPPNSNGNPAKHLPKVVINGNDIEISADHVMTEEHYIQYIWLRDVYKDEVVLVKACTPSEDKPFLKAKVPSGVTLSPCLYCNLHGLWRGEPFTIA